MVCGEMGANLVHGYRTGEGRFATVASDVSLGGFNHVVPLDAGLNLVLDRFERAPSDVAGIAPVLHVRCIDHV
jgi:hypothetical protein